MGPTISCSEEPNPLFTNNLSLRATGSPELQGYRGDPDGI